MELAATNTPSSWDISASVLRLWRPLDGSAQCLLEKEKQVGALNFVTFIK